MTASLTCPKCGTTLKLPQPAPEKITCTNCKAIMRISVPVPKAVVAPMKAAQHAVASKLVAGHELQRELARGGLGVVYLGFHPLLADFRAIKRPLPQNAADRALILGRFVRETQAVGGLRNNHVVGAYDAGEDDDGPYLVMEYLDGEAMSNLMARHRQLPVAEACELIRQAALGLQAAHERGLVHRDIKPSNLMLARGSSGTARIVVIDWGLVKRQGDDNPTHRLTRIGMEMGTPDFVSPEQIRDPHGVDIRADIYSLGATLYHFLAGQPPFHGRTEDQKITAQTKEEFPPLERLRPDLPKNVLSVLHKMVRKNPAERYQTPGEVAEALQPFGCAEPHRLSALLAPVSIQSAAPQDTKDLLEKATVLAPMATPAPTMAAPPEAQSQTRMVSMVVVAGLLIVLSTCVLISAIGIGVYWGKGKEKDPIGKAKDEDNAKEDGKDKAKDPPRPNLPLVLIDEDFRAALEKKRTLPEGWKSDDFRVVNDNGEPSLEVSSPTGKFFVELPPVSLRGNFYIEGVYLLDHFHGLSIRLDSRKTNAVLPIGIAFSGNVTIGDKEWTPLPTYKPYVPTHFVITREGNKMKVALKGEVVVETTLGAITEYESVRLYLPAGTGGVLRRPSRIYRLKIVTWNEGDPSPVLDAPPVPPPANGDKKKKNR